MDLTETPSGTGLTGDATKRPASPSLADASNSAANGPSFDDGPASKKLKTEESDQLNSTERRKGIAPIKAEYLLQPGSAQPLPPAPDDDAAEARSHAINVSDAPAGGRKFTKAEKQARTGQNKARRFGKYGEFVGLCRSRALVNEFSKEECGFGDKCRESHDIRGYLSQRENLNDTVCPVWADRGKCPVGWKCKWIKSHMQDANVPLEDPTAGETRKELQLIVDEDRYNQYIAGQEVESSLKNEISAETKKLLMHKKFPYEKSDTFLKYLDETFGEEKRDNNAAYKETRFRPSEKRRLHISAETPLLAPLTTTGNLPFRRLCTSLGASATYSEMAMSIPLIKGEKSEWALVRAHSSEKKFGVQISAKKPWEALKATEVLAHYCPSLHLIDMNSGCPIDLVYRSGGGAALMEQQSKLSKMMRGMNYVSGEIPITVKIRTGCSDKHPIAQKVIRRLVDEGDVAAITLHGRSRQQRYSREADWGYIAECSALIHRLKEEKQEALDTSEDDKEKSESRRLVPYFIGNGDCYSYEDYYRAVDDSHVDSVLIARGALMKPWIFEEIHARQYLDKTATERLAYVEQFAKYGLDCWGSDEMGVNNTRRFLCEYLSFTHRYVPVGLLEVLPPRIQDRPPRFKGRDELETLLASDDYRDWIKISNMFLGKASEDFKFVPKHKSNSYDAVDAEG
ncbi:tRNA-dihydrouridine synthase 3 [Orbilia blumenaviensis]|uniref:tRNA-dihydrouridine(47) synthase [NAD(P)(+)] n=1 Tax=Orbilia blumenaviensis TaxID=1796055 RepID=A0AAV9UVG2_9PEZI